MALPDTSIAARALVAAGPSSVRSWAGSRVESRSHRCYLAGGFGPEAIWAYCRAFTRGDW